MFFRRHLLLAIIVVLAAVGAWSKSFDNCVEDAFLCPNGDSLSRDPQLNCKFPACPSGKPEGSKHLKGGKRQQQQQLQHEQRQHHQRREQRGHGQQHQQQQRRHQLGHQQRQHRERRHDTEHTTTITTNGGAPPTGTTPDGRGSDMAGRRLRTVCKGTYTKPA